MSRCLALAAYLYVFALPIEELQSFIENARETIAIATPDSDDANAGVDSPQRETEE